MNIKDNEGKIAEAVAITTAVISLVKAIISLFKKDKVGKK